MFDNQVTKVILLQLLVLVSFWPEPSDSLIITSVLAGDKKFKTISFDHKFLKPLKFEKEMPLTEFRRHRTIRPPKFDIDVNIPIKLPLEDEYPDYERKKPVESNIFFQTDDIHEPSNYPQRKREYNNNKNRNHYQDDIAYDATSDKVMPESRSSSVNGVPNGSEFRQSQIVDVEHKRLNNDGRKPDISMSPRSDSRDPQYLPQREHQFEDQQMMLVQESASPPHSQTYDNGYEKQEFIPGGFVNLQLSGPTGGPKMTYEDYDREKWAQQLSQTPGAMPYPILNYQQLQNFYGGLGTFTNGLADNRYESHTPLLDKLMTGINQLANKIYWG